MRARIEKATGILVGKSLWRCTRAADLASFDFGERRTVPCRRGGTKEVGEYALHVQCAWRIGHGEHVIVGSGDLYYPADFDEEQGEIPPDFDWDHNPNRRDRLLQSLFEEGLRSFKVEAVKSGAAGILHIKLSEGFYLELFPDDSLREEQWRLFRPGVDEAHFVVTGGGTAGGNESVP